MTPMLGTIWSKCYALNLFGKVVVAGGAVRDELMGRQPKDYDVFILNCSWGKRDEIDKALCDYVGLKPFHKSEPYLVTTREMDGCVVQIMTTPYTNVRDLVGSFDWNVCLFAFDGEFHQFEKIDNIAPGRDLVLQKLTYPVSTLRRGFRFSERFGMHIPKETLKTICAGVLKTDDCEAQE